MPVHKVGKGHKGRRAAKNTSSGKHSRQRTRTTKNKKKRWKKHLEKNPDDNQGKNNIKKAENKLYNI